MNGTPVYEAVGLVEHFSALLFRRVGPTDALADARGANPDGTVE